LKNYEIALLVDVNLSSDVKVIVNEYHDMISKNFCNVHRVDDWGIKKLSYPIKKNYIANYVFITASLSTDLYTRLFSKFRQDKRVLRFLFVKSRGNLCVEEEKFKV
jgi:small subunit ribosomal protein S6